MIRSSLHLVLETPTSISTVHPASVRLCRLRLNLGSVSLSKSPGTSQQTLGGNERDILQHDRYRVSSITWEPSCSSRPPFFSSSPTYRRPSPITSQS